MIHILLNNTEVFTEKGASIKITKENPVLTGSGSYTFDINLPLGIAENKRFFGALDRIETHKEYTTYSSELKDDDRTLLIGTAVLTKATETYVSVQILAGNSNVRFWNNADTQFIDQYDLNIDEGDDIVKKWLREHMFRKWNGDAFNEWYGDVWEQHMNSEEREDSFWGIEGKFTAAPFQDRSKEGCNDEFVRFGNNILLRSGEGRHYFSFKTPHPNLLYVVRKICEYRGYTADLSYLQNTWVKDIYIASAIPTTSLALTLPHWTVKEFFDQFCKLFNVTMMFDDVKMAMWFVDNRSFFGTSIELTDMEDVFDNEISDSGEANIMFSNIGYAESNNKLQNVGKSIRDRYQTIEIKDYDDALARMRSDADPWAFYANNGDCYVAGWDADGVVWPNTCDIFRPLNRNSSTDVELKILPAKTDMFIMKTVFMFSRREDGYVDTGKRFLNGQDIYRYSTFTQWYNNTAMRMLDLDNGYGGYRKTSGTLLQKINGEDNFDGNGDKEDYMPIFMLSGSAVKVYAQHRVWNDRADLYLKVGDKFVYHDTEKNEDGEEDGTFDTGVAIRIPYTDRRLDGWQYPDENNSSGCEASLSIAGSRHDNEIADYHRNCPRFNERSQLHVRFLSLNIPDVLCCFLIRGKRYACKKIEYDIIDDGIDPLMTGYFVEILE